MLLVKLIEPPCTERYARWCERSGNLFKFPSYSIFPKVIRHEKSASPFYYPCKMISCVIEPGQEDEKMRKTIGKIRLSDLLLAVVTVIIVFSILGFIVIKSEAADKAYMRKHGKTGVEYVVDAD